MRLVISLLAYLALGGSMTGCSHTGSAGEFGHASMPGSVQVSGELGLPRATTTIPGNQLPPPEPKFGGVIKETALNSKPWWPPTVVPPRCAEYSADHDRRSGLRRFRHIRRRDSYSRDGSRCQVGITLHAISFDGALLADAC